MSARRDLFAQVLECFWKLEPAIGGVLRGVFARRVFIVPLFISEGYFNRRVIPANSACEPGSRRIFRASNRERADPALLRPGRHA